MALGCCVECQSLAYNTSMGRSVAMMHRSRTRVEIRPICSWARRTSEKIDIHIYTVFKAMLLPKICGPDNATKTLSLQFTGYSLTARLRLP